MSTKLKWIFFLSFSSCCSFGQVKILSHYISDPCPDLFARGSDIVTIENQKAYEKAYDLADLENPCIPLEGIDFTVNLLIGYKYNGSNCDIDVQNSRISKKDSHYLIQFATREHVCRDLKRKVAWFIIHRPPANTEIFFERTSNKALTEN